MESKTPEFKSGSYHAEQSWNKLEEKLLQLLMDACFEIHMFF